MRRVAAILLVLGALSFSIQAQDSMPPLVQHMQFCGSANGFHRVYARCLDDKKGMTVTMTVNGVQLKQWSYTPSTFGLFQVASVQFVIPSTVKSGDRLELTVRDTSGKVTKATGTIRWIKAELWPGGPWIAIPYIFDQKGVLSSWTWVHKWYYI